MIYFYHKHSFTTSRLIEDTVIQISSWIPVGVVIFHFLVPTNERAPNPLT